jgi:DNA-binding FrmR family transcriptional regulator
MKHASHPAIVTRLKRAHGHLAATLAMFEEGRSCLDLAQQLHAVESAIANAKRELIHDHLEHCLGDGIGEGEIDARTALSEFKALSKYL